MGPMRYFGMLFFALVSSCGLQSDVDHYGEYRYMNGTDVTDTVLYPMDHFVLVEEDALSGRTLVYLFSGELGQAGIGLQDLSRVAARFGGYRVSFRYPRSFYLAQPIESEGPAIQLISLDQEVGTLSPLRADEHLYLSGAFPILRSVNVGVSAWFGTFTNNEVEAMVEFEIAGQTIELDSPLGVPAFEVVPQEERITLNTGSLPQADYRIMDLFQTGSFKEDASPREFTVETWLDSDTDYYASHGLLQDAYEKACWSTEKSLKLRITQVAQQYVSRAGESWGIVYRRIHSRNVAPNDWLPLIDPGSPHVAAYCSNYD